MKIPGTLIASRIKEELTIECRKLREQGVTPSLAVILIGDDPPSQVYVSRKEKVGAEIGVAVRVHRMPSGVLRSTLLEHIRMLNQDPDIHGIIVQRPTPVEITRQELDLSVAPQKDVDGFHPQSPFFPPIASAILEILHWVYNELHHLSSRAQSRDISNNQHLISWLNEKSIVVIGRGETGGMPIFNTLKKLGLNPIQAHSKTEHIEQVSKNADIIISCVGKPNIVRHDMVTEKTILLGVGMHAEDDKMRADYDLDEISDNVFYYTPVPGGVGPVNVVCLMKNVIAAAQAGSLLI